MNELINETNNYGQSNILETNIYAKTNNYAKFSFYFHTLFFKNMTNSFA